MTGGYAIPLRPRSEQRGRKYPPRPSVRTGAPPFRQGGLWAVQAILVSVLPPAGEAPRSAEHCSATPWRVMREKARPSQCYRRCGKSQFLPHLPAVSREIDGCHLPRWGKDFYVASTLRRRSRPKKKRLPPSSALREKADDTSALRCPENTSGLRFSSCFPTAAEIAASLNLPPAVRGRNSSQGGRLLAPSPRELSQ